MVQRALPGQCLDPAHAGGDTAFGHDLEQADVARATDVGAATQLGGTLAHPQYPDLVAVLLAEQGHGAEIQPPTHAHRLDFVVVVGTHLSVAPPLAPGPSV